MSVNQSHGSIAQKCIHGAAKAAIIFGVLVIDILVVGGGLSLVRYLNPSFLGTFLGLIALGYAICGNIITYNIIKYSLLNLRHMVRSPNTEIRFVDPKPGWLAVKNAATGRLAITGGLIYFIIVLFGALIYVEIGFGIERGSTTHSLIIMGIFIATILGIIPLVTRTERISKNVN